MANKEYDSKINYYDILDLSSDASGMDIDVNYQQLKEKLIKEYKSTVKQSKKNEIKEQIELADEAYDVLSDDELRAEYDKSLAKKAKRGVKVTEAKNIGKSNATDENGEIDDDLEDDEEVDEEEVENARKKWKALGLTAAIIAVMVATGVTGYFLGKNSNSNKDKVVTTTESTVISGGDENQTTEIESSTSNNSTSENDTEEESRKSTYYGDITDSEEVTKRATELSNQLSDAGVINLTTGVPYTVGEIENLILYTNGAYVPETEQDIYDMYTEWLNFICGPLNMEDVIYQVNYQGGESSFADIIAENAKDPVNFNLNNAFAYGDANGIEYANWLQQKYFELLYSTNKEDYNRIYAEVWQSYADIMKGNGFKFYEDKEEYVITEQELLTKGNTGIGNMVSYWLFNFEVFRTNNTQENYDVVQKYLSADTEEQHDSVSIDEMFEYLNAMCDQDAYINGVDNAVDDNGESLHTMLDDVEGLNWGSVIQSNTKGIAYEVYYSNNNSLKNN